MKCLCDSGKEMDECCGPLLAGERKAESAEGLMRSRYSAYVRKDFEYILNTTDPQHRLDFDHDLSRDWMNSCTFTGLQVLHASEEGTKGVVEFIACFRRGEGAEEKHHERSRFRKQGGTWFFREGRIMR